MSTVKRSPKVAETQTSYGGMTTNPKAHQASQHTAKPNPTQTAGGHQAVAQKTSSPTHSTAERRTSGESASVEYAYRAFVELNKNFPAAIGDFTTRIESKFDAHRAEVKADIAEVRAEVKADIAEVRAEAKADNAEVGKTFVMCARPLKECKTI